MKIIRPTTITPAMLQSTDIPETDHEEWAIGTAFHTGDYCIVAAQHKIYQALTNVTGGSSPEIDVLAAVPKWQEIGATNRWRITDQKVQAQSSQAELMNWVFNPGLIDSIALFNVDASSVQIIMADQNTNIVTNGTAWTGATGTTQPTGWDKVGTPADYLIDSLSLKITTDAANEGCSQTIAVTAGTEMQLLGAYRNTAGDIAQYAVYDVTHSTDILATTDLASSTVESTLSYVFTVPVGCASLKISIMGKGSGDIVWFDTISLSTVVYNKTIDTITNIAVIDWYTYFFEPIIRATTISQTNLAEIGIPPITTASVTIIITNTGSTAKCGEIVMGIVWSVGSMKYSPSFSVVSYSQKSEDAWGNMIIVPGAYKTRLECSITVKNAIRSETHRQLILYKDTPTAWIGSESDRDSDLRLYGYYESFDTVLPYPEYSEMSLTILSLT